MGDVMGGEEAKYQKSYFDVQGLCCSSEVPLIEKILNPLHGIQKVSVVVPSKTVIVIHDSNLISQLQIVKALNQARLEASIRTYGTSKIVDRWPSPNILVCGVLLLASMFQSFFRPLRWLAVAAVVVGLPSILLRGLAALRRFNLDINILLLIAVAGALGMKDYTEAAFIVFLFTIAEWLESMASHKATAGMAELMSMAPQKATLAETGQVVDARDVKINTVLAVKAGEVIPIDGVVTDGHSEVDERTLTGESFPVAKQAESLVWAGTLNVDGYISVKTTTLAENSTVAKMARLVEEAQNSRSKTQRIIDSCAKYYTPAVVVVAAGIAAVPLVLRVQHSIKWFRLALVLLVSACPCALVLATPVATFCALLKAARKGLIIKGGDVLEALADSRVAAFDKTGTLTRGEFTVMEFRTISSTVSMEKLLYCVSSIESKSSHPMASALVDYARWKSIEPKPDDVTEFQIHPGEGIHGKIDGESIYIGNKRMAERAGCQIDSTMENDKQGVTIGYVFYNAMVIGIFTLSDTCRTGATKAIKELKSMGVKTAMLTGDSTAAAMHAQNQLDNAIEMIHAELLPEDKVRIVKDFKTKEGSTVMVGDGMNDAPALAMANVGISMGISGSAVAMETSHITLMSNDVSRIPSAIKLARRTRRKIICNILFAMATKIVILGLAFAGHPLLWAAVLADVGTCLIVIFNSMTLLTTRVSKKKKCCTSGNKSQACCFHENDCHDHSNPHEHGCHGQGKADERACCGNTHKDGCHEHHSTYEHGCHEHEKVHSENCHNHAKEHEHGCHEHEKVHAEDCHNHAKEHEHRCHEYDEVHSASFHDHLKEHGHGCHEHGKVHSASFHDHLKENEHGCHDHGRAHGDGCHEHEHTHEHGCHENEKIGVHGCHDYEKAHEHGCRDHGEVQEHRFIDACRGRDSMHEFGLDNYEKTHEHNCNDHMKFEESRQRNNSRSCKKQGCFVDSPNNSCCSSDMKLSQAHLIKIPFAEGSQNASSPEEYSGEKLNCGCTEDMIEHKSTRAATSGESVTNSAAVSCSEMGNRKKEISGCYTSARKDCGRLDGCSSSVSIRREIGSCCSYYKMECRKRNSCCGGAVVQIPEIIIE